MFDEATVSRLSRETGLDLNETRLICEQVERKPGVTSPFALARAWCIRRREALDIAEFNADMAREKAVQSRPALSLVKPASADSASQPQGRTGLGDGYADPEVAAEAIQLVHAMLKSLPEWQPSPRTPAVTPEEAREWAKTGVWPER